MCDQPTVDQTKKTHTKPPEEENPGTLEILLAIISRHPDPDWYYFAHGNGD